MRAAALCFTFAALAGAGYSQGISPRPDAGDYPGNASRDGMAIGAAMLGSSQIRRDFSTDLARGYLVVEVAVYPKEGTQLDLGPGDFWLRVPGSGEVLRPVAPPVVARALERPDGRGRNIALYPSVGIGYGSGRAMYGGGLGTMVGVGVGAGGPRPPDWNSENRRTMELELGEKQLPERLVAQPVAGYLYFSAPREKVRAACQLEYRPPAGELTLDVPAPAKQ
jgi:hypothetical protein